MATTDPSRRPVVAVVDDDPGVLQSIESLLTSADYEVRLFSSAMALLESGGLLEMDCLISDVAMPRMNGFELARAVEEVRPGLPILLITGRPDRLPQSQPDGVGPYRVFKKPFDGPELLTAVAFMLRTPRPPAPRA